MAHNMPPSQSPRKKLARPPCSAVRARISSTASPKAICLPSPCGARWRPRAASRSSWTARSSARSAHLAARTTRFHRRGATPPTTTPWDAQHRPRRGHPHRVEHVPGIESPDRPVVRERPLPFARYARDERDAHGPHEHGRQDRQGRATRGGPAQTLARRYRTSSS